MFRFALPALALALAVPAHALGEDRKISCEDQTFFYGKLEVTTSDDSTTVRLRRGSTISLLATELGISDSQGDIFELEFTLPSSACTISANDARIFQCAGSTDSSTWVRFKNFSGTPIAAFEAKGSPAVSLSQVTRTGTTGSQTGWELDLYIGNGSRGADLAKPVRFEESQCTQ